MNCSELVLFGFCVFISTVILTLCFVYFIDSKMSNIMVNVPPSSKPNITINIQKDKDGNYILTDPSASNDQYNGIETFIPKLDKNSPIMNALLTATSPTPPVVKTSPVNPNSNMAIPIMPIDSNSTGIINTINPSMIPNSVNPYQTPISCNDSASPGYPLSSLPSFQRNITDYYRNNYENVIKNRFIMQPNQYMNEFNNQFSNTLTGCN